MFSTGLKGAASSGRVAPVVVALPTTNLVAYYEGNVGVTHVANQVSQWDDQSGNARHMTQVNALLRGTWNGTDAIAFTAVQFSSSQYVVYLETFAQPLTVYVVLKHNTTISLPHFGKPNSDKFTQIWSTGELEVVGNTGVNTTPTIAINTYFLARTVFDSTNSIAQINNTTAATGDITQTGSFDGYRVGAEILGTGTHTIKAAYIYSTNAADDAGIKAYILYKYPGLY